MTRQLRCGHLNPPDLRVEQILVMRVMDQLPVSQRLVSRSKRSFDPADVVAREYPTPLENAAQECMRNRDRERAYGV